MATDQEFAPTLSSQVATALNHIWVSATVALAVALLPANGMAQVLQTVPTACSRSQIKLFPCDLGAPEFPTFGGRVVFDRGVIAVSSLDDAVPAEPGVVCVYEQDSLACCSIVSPDEDSSFGRALELQGGELFVAALDALYVYRRVAAGVWIRSETLPGSEIVDVSVDGDRLAVSTCEPTRGVVLFDRQPGGGWSEAESIPLPPTMGCFMAVSLEGRYLLVKGSPSPSSTEDKAFVYVETPSGWVQDDVLEPDSYGILSDFGRRLQLWKGRAYVCDPGNAVKGSTPNTGVVFVYERSDSDEEGWYMSSVVEPRDGERLDNFGGDVLVNEEGLFIGAYSWDSRLAAEAGAVYHYQRTGGQDDWVLSKRIVAFDPQPLSDFGWSIAGADGVLVVGAPYSDTSGAAYCIDIGSPIAARQSSSR